MQVVDVEHARYFPHGVGQALQLDTARRGLHQDEDRLAHDLPRPDRDEQGYEQGENRIEDVDMPQEDGRAGRDDGQ